MDVSGANGDLMAASRQTAGEGADDARDSSVSPCGFTVRRYVQYAKTHELEFYTSTDIQEAVNWLATA